MRDTLHRTLCSHPAATCLLCSPSSPLSHSPYSRSVRAPPVLSSPLPRAATALWRVAARGSAARRRPLRTTGRRRAPVGPASLPLLPPRPTRHRRSRHRLRSSPAPAPARSRHTHPPHPPSSSHGGGAAVSGERRHTLPPSSFPASFPASSSSPSPQVLPVSPAVDPVRWCGPRLFSTTAAAAAAAAARRGAAAAAAAAAPAAAAAAAVAVPATARGGG